MCLAVPAKVTGIVDMFATVTAGGVSQQVSILLLPDVHPDEWVLVHAGFAIQTIDQEEAENMLALYRQLAECIHDESE